LTNISKIRGYGPRYPGLVESGESILEKIRKIEKFKGWSQMTVLSDSATPSNLNAFKSLTVKDNIMLNPIFGMLSSRGIQNIPDMIGYL